MNKTELLQVIMHYRDVYKQKIEQPGWTTWALFGASASIIWYILKIYSKDKYNIIIVFDYLFGIYIIYSLIKSIHNLVSFLANSRTQNKISNFSYSFSKGIKNVIFTTTVSVVLLFYVNLSLLLPTISTIVFNIMIIVNLVIIIFAIVIYALRIPLFSSTPNRITGFFIFIILYVTPLSIIVIYGTTKYTEMDLTNLLYALPYFALYVLLTLLMKQQSEEYECSILDRLYDDVLFNPECSYADVLAKIETIVVGYKSNQIVEAIINEYEQLLMDITEKANEVKKYMQLSIAENNNDTKNLYISLCSTGIVYITKKLDKAEIYIYRVQFAKSVIFSTQEGKKMASEIEMRLMDDFSRVKLIISEITNLQKNYTPIESNIVLPE